MTAEKLAAARSMYDTRRYTMDQIAKAVGVGRSTLYRYLGEDAAPVGLPMET